MQAALAYHANYDIANVNHEFTTRDLLAEMPVARVPVRARYVATESGDPRQAIGSDEPRQAVGRAGKNTHQQSAFMLALWRSLSAWSC